MIQSDFQKTNLTVDNLLLVKGSIVTPLLKTHTLQVDGKTLDQILSETVPNIDTTNLVATNITTTNLTTTGNLFLPTSGGTPTSLNFYEEFKGTADFTSTAFAGTQSVNLLLTRIGNLVTMQLSGFTVAGSGLQGTLDTVTPIPERFISGELSFYMIRVMENFGLRLGMFTMNVDGTFEITRSIVVGGGTEVSLASNAFSGNGNLGFFTFSISWIV